MTEEIIVLKDISNRLHNIDIPYMITGSMAMNLYAIPRMTRDIDIVVELPQDKVAPFIHAVRDSYYVDGDSVNQAIRYSPHMFKIIHETYIVKMDFFIRCDSKYALESFSRRRSHVFYGEEISVISSEDLILAKLNWARDSYSEIQIIDIQTLLNCALDLDMVYIEYWILKLELQEIWEVTIS